MGSQWVRDLETIATALLSTTNVENEKKCSFCNATIEGTASELQHTAKCPIALAQKIVDEVEFVHRSHPMM